MIVFPNAKINLGLNIIEKRSDGYHNLETVFYPVAWRDMLEILPSERKINRKSEVQFHSSGVQITGGSRKNTCVKAYQLLKQTYPVPPIQMHLHKCIPAGAGLGGGSSDAAHTLLSLNDLFSLGISKSQLERLASEVGADCAFFIRNRPVFATGIGDKFSDISIDLSGYFLVIVKPDVHVNTAGAYKNIVPARPEIPLSEAIRKPVETWKDWVTNDFEKTVFKKHPEIRHVKEQFYEEGAIYASMSGSGSAVYGIFKEAVNLKSRFPEYAVWHQLVAAT